MRTYYITQGTVQCSVGTSMGGKSKDEWIWASMVVHWLRICLAMQGTPIESLVWEDPTCHRATKAMHHNYGASSLGPMLHNERSHRNEKLMCCN